MNLDLGEAQEVHTPVQQLIRQRPLSAFFVMAFVFSWLAVLPLILSRYGIIAAKLPVEPFQIAGALAGPTLAALVVTAATQGRAGIRQLLRRYVQWRAHPIWYLLILVGPLLVLTLTGTAFLGSTFIATFVRSLPQVLVAYIPTLILGSILGPLWEEPGWRGVALPRLQQRYGPLIGTVVLGTAWALWHLPAFFGGWMGPLGVSAILGLLVGSVAFSLLMTWIYNGTRGSILLMILLHSASNAAVAAGGLLLPADIPANIAGLVYNGWIPAIGYMMAAVLVLVLTRGRLSYRPEG